MGLGGVGKGIGTADLHFDNALRQMTGYGGVVSFEVKGGREHTSLMMDRLRLPYIGPTLGGV